MNAHRIRSPEHLLHMLAEASELEHNLLCSYLYAAFSLKRQLHEDLLPHELDAVRRWRASIMEVCMEEMGHLAQVANLMVAVGSRPHFDRPNLPIGPGYHPAGIQVALARFNLDTLDHFIFLERPETSTLEDAPAFQPSEAYERQPESGVLMPSAPDYATIGEFYELLTTGLEGLAAEMGEDELFIGPKANQLRPDEIGFDDLSVVTDLASAQRALHLIVVQGEGSASETDVSHFKTFSSIKTEYLDLCAARPAFDPSRNVARNPVMRRPMSDDRVHIAHRSAAAVLDAANAVYSLMLRCLTAVYDTGSEASSRQREALLGCAIGLMKLLGQLSEVLTSLPASEPDGVRAGVTFAMLRSTEGLAPGVDVGRVLRQRFERIEQQIPRLDLPAALATDLVAQLEALKVSLA